jgi:hypothetical protein
MLGVGGDGAQGLRRPLPRVLGRPRATPAPDARGVRAEERQADPAAAYWKATTNTPDKERDEDTIRAKVRAALTARQELNAEAEKPEAPPVGLHPATIYRVIEGETPYAGFLFLSAAQDRNQVDPGVRVEGRRLIYEIAIIP